MSRPEGAASAPVGALIPNATFKKTRAKALQEISSTESAPIPPAEARPFTIVFDKVPAAAKRGDPVYVRTRIDGEVGEAATGAP